MPASSLVVVAYFDIVDTVPFKNKADSPLVVYRNGVLAFTIALEGV